MSKIELIKGSCADQEVDIVVNAANRNLWSGGGICGAIFKKAGYQELTDACSKIKTPLKDGEVAITPAFKSEFSVKKGMRLLLKNKDNIIVELRAMDDAYYLVKAVDAFQFVYYLNAFYEVSEETLSQLCGGIIKMRFEYDSGVFDKEWKEDRMGEVLKKEFAEIKRKIRIEKDFYSDF